MSEGEEKPDLPKIVGAVGVKFPMLVVRLGVSYLRLKRNANRASRTFVAELESGGMPSDYARKLGHAYGSDISIRKFLTQTGAGGIQGVRLR
jgi:ribosomal protein L13E